jgi:hypothetical protein
LAYEGSLLCVAQWKALFGKVEDVQTPVLDYIRDHVVRLRDGFNHFEAAPVADIHWKPEVILPLAAVWTVIGVLILRRA